MPSPIPSAEPLSPSEPPSAERALELRYRDAERAAELARAALADGPEAPAWAEVALAACLSRIPERIQEARTLLERVLASGQAEARLRCAALHELGENRALADESRAALDHLREALALAERTGWRESEWKILSRAGGVLTGLGEFREALGHLLRALRLHNEDTVHNPAELGDQAAWERGTLYGRLGMVYSNLDDGVRAISHYEAALACFGERYPQRAGRTLYRMGIAAEEHLRDFAAAEDYYRRSQELLGRHGSPAGRGLGLGGIGRVLYERQRYVEARAAFAEAIDLVERDPVHRHYLPDALRDQADTHLRLGLPREALAYLDRALPMYESDHRPAAHHAALQRSFYEAHLALGDHASALRHHQLYHALQMRHAQEQTDWRLAEMMVQFDTEVAMRERELSRLRSEELEREVAERKEAEVALARARDELEAMNRELHALTIRDPLTGVFNRRHLDERFAEAFALARRQRQALSVMICDIDDFKQINDVHTHGVGDEVLRRVARLIRGHVRQSDVVARFGGEEFVVLFPATNLDEAAAACEKLRELIERERWGAVSPGLRVTLSCGVAEAGGEPDHERLLAEADRRLYRAKREGKNRVVGA